MQASSASSKSKNRGMGGFFSMASDGAPKLGLEKVNTMAKMFISILASVLTIALSTFEAQLFLFGVSFIYALGLPKVRFLFIAYALSCVMFGLATLCSYLLSLCVPLPLNMNALMIPFLRMVTMLNVVLPLALSTRVQNILTALKSMRLPFCIYLPAAVMIRFIPTFIHDIKQVAETLKIRGYVMSVGETMRHPFLMMRLLFTPLLFRSLRTSEELGIAGELKGMNAHTKMSRYKKEDWTSRDTLLLVTVSLAVLVAVYIEMYLGVDVKGGHR